MPTMRARYEFKYLVTEAQAAVIRDVARTFCDPDPYGDDGNYEVASLYLDTWDFKLASQTQTGVRNRYKARIRTYGWSDTDLAFLEIKERVGISILKQRALIERRQVHDILADEPGPFTAKKASHQPDLEFFLNRMVQEDLRPRLWVRYFREAYASRFGDNARLTFDRQLVVQTPAPELPYVPDHDQWVTVPLEGPPTILEMKFDGAHPRWMLNLAHGLGLKRVSCSKYMQGVVEAGDVPFSATERGWAWMAS